MSDDPPPSASTPAADDWYYSDETLVTLSRVVSTSTPDACAAPCTLSVGRYIDPHGTFGAVLDLPASLPVCPAGRHCVGDPSEGTEGCCLRCADAQYCGLATVALVAHGDASGPAAWNVCPGGHACFDGDMSSRDGAVRECEAGYMCQHNRKMSCAVAHRAALDAGYGDVHAGSYCPPGSSGLRFCPQGSYCPADMSTVLPCPAGYFCPLKTRTPTLRCRGCPPGATEIVVLPFPPYLAALAFGAFVAALYVLVQIYLARRQNAGAAVPALDTAVHLSRNESFLSDSFESVRSIRSVRKARSLVKRTFVLECVDPQECEDSEEDEEAMSHWEYQQSLSDLLDRCVECGVRHGVKGDFYRKRYADLEQVLGLGGTKMIYFVRKMNEAAGAPSRADSVDQGILIDNFHEVFTNAQINAEPMEADAAEIFDMIDADADGRVSVEELYGPVLEEFLGDNEIYGLVRRLRNRAGKVLSKESFVQHYGRALGEVVRDVPCDGERKRGIDVEFIDLSLSVRVSGEAVRVVDRASGKLRQGTVTAVMGGSGTGKTSLLNALSGRAYYGEVTGSILINGLHGRIEDHKHLVGFVPQDDFVNGELTVRENLQFAGRFRLAAHTSMREISDLADGVIASLGLVRVRDSIVGDARSRGISGGERKRVNIGVELMGRPHVLFLDEPTSGLDSSSSSLVMSGLKRLAEGMGVTVACVIHQPRKFIFDLFDNIILFVSGGKVIYEGHPDLVEGFFSEAGYVLPPGENVADWIVDISSGSIKLPKLPSCDDSFRDNADTMRSISDLMRAQISDVSRKKSEERNLTREFLSKRWMTAVQNSTNDPEDAHLPKRFLMAPEKVLRPSFLCQMETHIQRNFLGMYRNRISLLFDTAVIILAVFFINAGTVRLVSERFLSLDHTVPMSVLIRGVGEMLPLDAMFQGFQRAAQEMIGDGLKIAVIVSVLVGLSATKAIGDKKMTAIREASSGYNLNSYFIAVNISSTIEHSIQMALAGLVCAFVRGTVSSWFGVMCNFIMLGWISVSWAFLFSVVVPLKNLVVVVGFYMAFFGLLAGGGIPPIEYKEIYSNTSIEIMCGLFSPTRFFIETVVVSDFRCLLEQTGFSQGENSVNFPEEKKSFTKIHLGLRDKSVGSHRCNGWYWGYLPSFLVGLAIRVSAGLLLHMVNRSKQSKVSLRKAFLQPKFALAVFGTSFIIILLFALAIFTFIVERRW